MGALNKKILVYGGLVFMSSFIISAYDNIIQRKTQKFYIPHNDHILSIVERDSKKDLKENIIEHLYYVEDYFGFEEHTLYAIAKQESGLNQKAKSHANAYGVMQVRKIALEELKRIYNKSKSLIEAHIEEYSLEYVDFRYPETYNEVEIKKHLSKQKEIDLRYFYVPVYLALRSIDIENISFNEVVRDYKKNIEVGGAYLFLIKKYFSTLMVMKTKKGPRLIRRPEQFFEQYPHLRVIPEEYGDIEYWVIYNMGFTKAKRLFEKKIYYSTIRKSLPWETEAGIENIRKYYYLAKKNHPRVASK